MTASSKRGGPSLHAFIAREAASTGQPKDRLTKAQRDMLERAVREPTGEPLRTYGRRQMAGGSIRRMYDLLKSRGYFDDRNRITDAGRSALQGSTDQ